MASAEINATKWLRCNRCFKQMGKTFSLTCCSHIFCNVCIAHAKAKNECPRCHNNDLQMMTIKEALKSKEIKHCFEPVEEPFAKLHQAFMFQKMQLQLNSARLQEIEMKYFKFKERFLRENKIIKEHNTELLTKLNQLANENQELKARKLEPVAYMLTTTPTYSAHSIEPPQQFPQNPRIGSSRFLIPRNPERRTPRAQIGVLTQNNAEFLMTGSSRIPRSVGSSTLSSSNPSSKTTPFTDYRPNRPFNLEDRD